AAMSPPPWKPVPLRLRDPDDPERKSVELVQRGRMILDVAAADLEASESLLGHFHQTTWFFRNALAEARRSWDRLRAAVGAGAPVAPPADTPLPGPTLADPDPPSPLIPVFGKTYPAARIPGPVPAPAQWPLPRPPPSDDGPYYACRLHDATPHCDCAEWV